MPLPSLDTFKTKLAGTTGLAQGLFYRCEITLQQEFATPESAVGTTGTVFRTGVAATNFFTEDDGLLCKSVTLPVATIDNSPLKYFTRTITVPGSRQFSPLSISLYNTTTYNTRSKFLQWIAGFNLPVGNVRDTQADPQRSVYYGEVKLRVYHNQATAENIEDEIGLYTFQKVYPTSVSALQYGYENDGQIQTYDVELQFLTMTFEIRTK